MTNETNNQHSPQITTSKEENGSHYNFKKLTKFNKEDLFASASKIPNAIAGENIDPKAYYDQVNVRLPAYLNDWLNDVVRYTKRYHGAKIPKEVIIEVSLQKIFEMELDWAQISDAHTLSQSIDTQVKNKNATT